MRCFIPKTNKEEEKENIAPGGGTILCTPAAPTRKRKALRVLGTNETAERDARRSQSRGTFRGRHANRIAARASLAELQIEMGNAIENCSLNNLNELMALNANLKRKLNKLFEEEYNSYVNKLSVQQRVPGQPAVPTFAAPRPEVAYNFSGVRMGDLEKPTSPHYARESLANFDILSNRDQKFALHLVRTAKINSFKLPKYSDLLTARREDDKEYDFEIDFSFGYTYADNCRTVKAAFEFRSRRHRGETQMPADICNEIAKFIGNSQFEILLKVYFDKTKSTDWHEQDGEAWIYHPYKNTRERIDLVNFDRNDRIYYVEHWPETGLLSDNYTAQGGDAQNTNRLRSRLERTMVTWVCSQITWLTMTRFRQCKSVKVRNRHSMLLFVLKGWFTGLLLGESFDPEDMRRLIEIED